MWWISFTFLEDLVYRNGLTIEGVAEFDELDAEHQQKMIANENRRNATAALAWDQRPASVTDRNCIIGRAFRFGTIDYGERSKRKRKLAQVNPYQRRILISKGFADAKQIVQPPFGDGEEQLFKEHLEAEGSVRRTSDCPGAFGNGLRQRRPGSIAGSGEPSCHRGCCLFQRPQ